MACRLDAGCAPRTRDGRRLQIRGNAGFAGGMGGRVLADSVRRQRVATGRGDRLPPAAANCSGLCRRLLAQPPIEEPQAGKNRVGLLVLILPVLPVIVLLVFDQVVDHNTCGTPHVLERDSILHHGEPPKDLVYETRNGRTHEPDHRCVTKPTPSAC